MGGKINKTFAAIIFDDLMTWKYRASDILPADVAIKKSSGGYIQEAISPSNIIFKLGVDPLLLKGVAWNTIVIVGSVQPSVYEEASNAARMNKSDFFEVDINDG